MKSYHHDLHAVGKRAVLSVSDNAKPKRLQENGAWKPTSDIVDGETVHGVESVAVALMECFSCYPRTPTQVHFFDELLNAQALRVQSIWHTVTLSVSFGVHIPYFVRVKRLCHRYMHDVSEGSSRTPGCPCCTVKCPRELTRTH